MASSLITRLAPTPSGYLHTGNLVNFVLTSRLATAAGGTLGLRIDDMDTTRVRPQFLSDIFRALDWLEITWQRGPQNVDDHNANFAMHMKTDHYRATLGELAANGLEVFACRCSRTELVDGRFCGSGCRDAGLRHVVDRTALRVSIPEGTMAGSGGQPIDLRAAHGDVVLWRRDDLPAYHLVTIVEDRDLSTTDIVRGLDLRASSALHEWLSTMLPGSVEINYWHHGLITSPDGRKLSKSHEPWQVGPRTPSDLERVRELAERFADDLGGPWSRVTSVPSE